MNRPHPHHTDLFAIFLAALLVAILLLTLLVLHGTALLTPPVLTLIAAAMALTLLLLMRWLFPTPSPHKLQKRLTASILGICVITACAACSYRVLLLSHSLHSMFGAIREPLTAQLQTAREEPFALYLAGSDTRSSTLTKSRFDVNILAIISPAAHQVLLVSTPRDYYVPNPAGGGAKDKLTHCGLYGLDNAKRALSELYGIPIAYGAVINFSGFQTLIDAMGGITVISDTAFTTTVGNYPIIKGENQLDGARALAFARERKHLPQGDNARGKNQIRVLTAMLRRCAETGLGSRLPAIASALEGTFTTDLPPSLLAELTAAYLADMEQWELLSLSVTGTDDTARCWSLGTAAYVMHPDASAKAAGELMTQMLQGAVLTPDQLP